LYVVPSLLQPVNRRSVALRILHNLRTAYTRAGDVPKAQRVERLLLEAGPA
jgi:hypothetical protein